MTPATKELVEFILREVPAEKLLAFGPSASARQSALDLVARSKDDALTPDERAELDECMILEHMIRLVKARARTFLNRR
ncbi:MAG TPA: hypothetical protein VFE47_03435 [Tepidisphaeraceae bacterium]|jgi:hypothetical protein|nr:hypothetical protein [Tepidisphaeraceae bacterium]